MGHAHSVVSNLMFICREKLRWFIFVLFQAALIAMVEILLCFSYL